MRSNIPYGRIAVCAVSTALFAMVACSDDGSPAPSPEAGTGGGNTGGSSAAGGKGNGGASTGGKAGSGGSSAGGSAGRAGGGGTAGMGTGGVPFPDGGDAGPPNLALCAGKTGKDLVTCGQYIVEHIDACADCHSPRLQNGAPDPAKILAGNPSFADIDPAVGVGNVPTPNLTQLKRDGWTADDIMTAILDGKARTDDGGTRGLFPAMPYQTFHNMAKEDAAAIAAYILSLTYIPNDIPAREPLGPIENALPLPTVKVADIPDPVIAKTDPSYDQAQLGKYLATQVGVCMECHTERNKDGTINMAKAFAGGETFELGPPFFTVTSENLTPDPTTGLKNWTPGLVRNLIKTGKTDTGDTICPPMPVGPNGAFGGMTDEHALAIGAYITHLAAISNGDDAGGRFPMCVLPRPSDAGPPVTDAAKD